MQDLATQGSVLNQTSSATSHLENRSELDNRNVDRHRDIDLQSASISHLESHLDNTNEHQSATQLPSSDILASLASTSVERLEQEVPNPARASTSAKQLSENQQEKATTEQPTTSVIEQTGGLLGFFEKARNAVASIIPEPVKDFARSVDRALSETFPIWNDFKEWASDVFESVCDFFDDLFSENETNSTSDMPSSQSNHVSKKTEVNSESERIDAASDKHQSEEEKKMELRNKIEELCYDIFSKKKKEDDLDLDKRLKEAVARMLAAVEREPDSKEQERAEALSKQNNFIVDTFKEKQELLDEAMSRENETSSALMNTFLREHALDDTFRALEPFGFTPEQAEALIKAAISSVEKPTKSTLA